MQDLTLRCCLEHERPRGPTPVIECLPAGNHNVGREAHWSQNIAEPDHLPATFSHLRLNDQKVNITVGPRSAVGP